MKLWLSLLWVLQVFLQFIKGHVVPLLMTITRERVSVGSLVGSFLITILVVWYMVRNKAKHYVKENEQGPSPLYELLVVSVIVIVATIVPWTIISSGRQEPIEAVKCSPKERRVVEEGSVESQPAIMTFSPEDKIMCYEFGSDEDEAEDANMAEPTADTQHEVYNGILPQWQLYTATGCARECGKLYVKYLVWIAWITDICTRKFKTYHNTVSWALVLLLLAKTLVKGTSNIRFELKVVVEETTIGDPVLESFKKFPHDHVRGIKDQHDVVHSDKKKIWTDRVRELSDPSFLRSWSRPIQDWAVPFSIVDEHLLLAELVSLVLIAWAIRVYITGIHRVEPAPPIEETCPVGLSLFNGMMLLLEQRLDQLIRNIGTYCLNQCGGNVGNNQQINPQCQGTQPRQRQPQSPTAQPHYQDAQLHCQETQSQHQQAQATDRKSPYLPRPVMPAGSVTRQTIPDGGQSEVPAETSLEELQAENTTLREYWKCKRCNIRMRTIMFSPCNHVSCCATCAPLVKMCPQCGVNVANMMVVHTCVRPPND